MKTFSMVMAVLLIVGFLFVGCDALNDMLNNNKDNDEEEDVEKFEGTWMNPYGYHPAFTFTGNKYKLFYAFAFDSVYEGTFTFTDKTITFIPEKNESWTQTYTLSGNTLSLDADGQHNYGPFVKNFEPKETKFEGVWNGIGDTDTSFIILTFRYDCFSVSYDGENGEYSDYGNFTFDNTAITFTDWNGKLKWKNDEYTLSDTNLTLSDPKASGWAFWGTYTKQPE